MMNLVIMKNPNGKWDAEAGDYHLDFIIDGEDFDAIQRAVNISPPPIEKFENESYEDETNRLKNRHFTVASEKGYEMLGRIWDWYDDAIYLSTDVKKLREECLEAKSKSQDIEVMQALDKLILACDAALENDSGIYIACD